MIEAGAERTDGVRGLSEAEAVRRRERGLGNPAPRSSTRTYPQIVRENVFTFVNDILFVLAAALVLVGRPLDGLVSLGVIGTNIVVGVVQEVRAKRVLDGIAAMQVPTARVVRDGSVRGIRPEELVLGDLVAVEPGDVVALDGTLVSGAVEVDESLLTGESDTVHKEPGDSVASGSSCLSGSGRFTVTAVGEASLANRITAGGRRFRRVLTPLQREIHLVIRVAFAIVVYLQLVLVLDALVSRVALPEAVGQATVLAGLVPNGLFVAIAITYAAAAVRIARMGALVQQANAIESLSHVDTLCLDKTGTLTANAIALDALEPVDGDEPGFRRVLGTMLASASTRNRTAEAILRDCPGTPQPIAGEVAFSSARAWSAVAFPPPGRNGTEGSAVGTLVIGAPSAIIPELTRGGADEAAIGRVLAAAHDHAARGLRVLLLARHAGSNMPGDGHDPALPRPLELVGALALRDVLRDDLGSTLERFSRSGVSLRVISGDDPDTVAALVRQAGLDLEPIAASGPALGELDEPGFAAAVAQTHVFGRITPALKERIVETLKASGRYVAMIGDGVNDVLPMKRADLAVAMGSGSQATRGVADLVLLDDSFASLSRAVEEGHRILNGMQPVLELFLTRIATLGLVVMSSLVVEYFPIELRNASAVTLFTVGIPSVLVALWANPRPRPATSLGRTLVRFVAPATLVSSLIGLLVFYGSLLLVGAAFDPGRASDPVAMARSALTCFLVLSGILLVLFAAPPTRAFAVVEPESGDRRTLALALGLVAGFVAVLAIPAARSIFDLDPIPPAIGAFVLGSVALWAAVLSVAWRRNVVERFVGLEAPSVGARSAEARAAP